METVEGYLKHHALHFYLSDSVRHLAAVVPLDPSGASVPGGGALLNGDRVVTPQSSASGAASPIGAPPSTPPTAVSTSGVYSPTSPPPAGPTIPTAASSGVGVGASVGGISGGGTSNISNAGAGALSGSSSVLNHQWSVYNFDDMLSELPQYYQDVLCGRHIAGLGAPWEYILCTRRNRLALCLLVHRAVTHVMPGLLVPTATAGGVASPKRSSHVDLAAGLLDSVIGITPSEAAAGVDLQALFGVMVQLHCSDMPRTWLHVILRRAAAIYARQNGTANNQQRSAQVMGAPLLAPHALVLRMFLLHVCCKELVEDLQAAFPVGGGGAPSERCRSDLCTWRRTFDRWGLDGSWRCGAPRSTASTATAFIASVQPYIPVSIVNSMFDTPSAIRDATVGASGSTPASGLLSLDADAVCSLIVHSDEWFLWCCDEHDSVVACSYT